MFKKLSAYFSKNTRAWIVLVLLAMIIGKLFFLPIFEAAIEMPENVISLDAMNFYSPDAIYKILTDWGDEGRYAQIILHATWDLIFPLLYFFFLGFLFSLLTKAAFLRNSKWQYLNLLSLVAVVDLLENCALFLLIAVYPHNIAPLGYAKTIFTVIKYCVFGPAICFGLLSAIFLWIKIHVAKHKSSE